MPFFMRFSMPAYLLLYVMQYLVSALAQEESAMLQAGLAYPVWSPYDAVEAVHTMLAVLKTAESERHA
ncbi:MAG TPA: hypothetical protein VIH59_33850 [Candidatus Tectomicrobia bacterium]|jgi:hypothetical protein